MPVAIFVLLLTSPFFAQEVFFSEIMFDPIGSEQTDEFIELYNGGSVTVDLSGWAIADSLSSDLIIGQLPGSVLLQPGEFMLLFDANYIEQVEGRYDSLIPPSAVTAQIDGVTFGSGGLTNSRSKTLYLLNTMQDTIASYRYSTGNAPGFSDEKIDLSGSDLPENWGDSSILNGTPGFLNSRAVRNIDLVLRKLSSQDSLLISEHRLTFALELYNRGRMAISWAELQVFQDHNKNKFPDGDEAVTRIEQLRLPEPGDSLTIEIDFADVIAGRTQLCVRSSIVASDTITAVACWNGVIDDIHTRLLINEIMASPAGDRGEWIEIVNRGLNVIDLSTVVFSDSRDSVLLPELLLEPNGLLVLSGDATVASDYNIAMGNAIVVEGFPSLNNASDNLSLSGLGGWPFDRVTYFEDWYQRDVGAGVSLEKYNPDFNGKMRENWSASVAVDGHSAGRQNSVFLSVLPSTSNLSIRPNPFSPDGDGHEDVCLISYQLPEATAFVALRIYDLRGRLVHNVLDGEASASSGEVLWNGKNSDEQSVRSGVYIALLEAVNTQSGAMYRERQTFVLVRRPGFGK